MVRAVHLRVLPETRGECRGGARPCPLVSCRMHLLLDVAEDGRLFMTRDLDEGDADSIVDALREMPETCALDVAAAGGMTFEQVAVLMSMRKQSVDQVEKRALERLRAAEHDWEEREHPEDFYVRYSNMGATELAEVAAELRRRNKR